jgi:predicted nucleic acid-binding protein
MSVVLGFDSSVLNSFARAKRLDVLQQLTAGHRCVVTRAVLEELDRGRAVYPQLGEVRALSWLELVVSDSLRELAAFSHYVRVLGPSDRNIGEASILAWAEVSNGVALVDDQVAVKAGKARSVAIRRSLGLVCNGLQKKVLTIERARVLVNELIDFGGARFPCDGDAFESWAEREGLLPST